MPAAARQVQVVLLGGVIMRRIVFVLAGLLFSCSAALAVPVKIDFTGQAFTTPFLSQLQPARCKPIKLSG